MRLLRADWLRALGEAERIVETYMSKLVIKCNELTAAQFIELWETVWGNGPSFEQTELAMNNTRKNYDKRII